MRHRILAAATAAVAACMGRNALADKVQLNNGDTLTGTVETYDGSKLTLKTAAAGEVKVDMKEVKTFSTDNPITLKLIDGALISQRAVAATEPGAIEIFNAQALTLNQIKAINPPTPAWTGDIKAGADLQRGNTFVDEYHAGFDLNRSEDDDRFTSDGLYQFGRQKNPQTGAKTTTVQNWVLNAEYKHFFHATKWYSFASVIVAKDQIQDLNLRVLPSVGVGYQWIESPLMNFNTEAGLAYIYEDYSTQSTRTDFALKFAYHFDKQLTDHLKLVHNLEYDPSIEDGKVYIITADVGLREEISKALFVEAKIQEVFNSDPAPTHDKNDTQYIVSVGYKF